MLRSVNRRLRPPSLPTAISLLALSIAITGTAYAAAPTVFSIADHTRPARTAKVSVAGALSTTGTFTGFRVANQSAASTTVSIYEFAEPSASCSTSPATSRFLGQFSVPNGETVDEQRTTPQIVKPLPGSPYWCFVTFASGSSGTAFY